VKDVGAPGLCIPLLLPTTCSPARDHSTSSHMHAEMWVPQLAASHTHCPSWPLPVPHREAALSALGRDRYAHRLTASSFKPGVDCCCFHPEVSLFPVISLLI